MVLGRVWYQGEYSETLVVWGSLAAHIASGVLGRAVKAVERTERRKRRRREVLFDAEKSVGSELDATVQRRASLGRPDDEDELLEDEIRAFEEIAPASAQAATTTPALDLLGPFNLSHLTGYVLIPMVLKHGFLHRILPSFSSAPFLSLSPTLFSYSFVSYSLSAPSHRTKSAIAYTAILVVAGYHAISGLRRIIDPMAPRGLRPKRAQEGEGVVGKVRRRGWQGVYLGGVVAVGIGMARLAAEGNGVPLWIGRKYEAVLNH